MERRYLNPIGWAARWNCRYIWDDFTVWAFRFDPLVQRELPMQYHLNVVPAAGISVVSLCPCLDADEGPTTMIVVVN